MAEEQEEPKGEASEESTEDKKGKGKLIAIIAAATVLVLAAGGGAFFFMSGGGEDQEMAAKAEPEDGDESSAEDAEDTENAQAEGGEGAEGGENEAAGDGEQEKPAQPQSAFGETYPLKTFHLNLGNPLENHYIRVDVAIEFRGGETQRVEIDRRLPQLRDAIVGVIGRQTRDMILDPDGKAQLRREMLIRINRYMSTPIEAVYITDILIE